MLQKFALENSPVFALAAFALLVTNASAAAQTIVSFGQTNNLPALDAQAPPKAAHLFTINEENSLPTVSGFSKARIVDARIADAPIGSRRNHRQTSAAAQIPQPTTVPVQPETIFDAIVTSVAKVAPPLPTPLPELPSANQDDGRGYYTVAFSQSDDSPQKKEPNVPELKQLQYDDSDQDDLEKDLVVADADELDLSADDEDEAMEDGDLEDDSPIARPELGMWPSKSIQEVRVDATERGANVPEDRSGKLFDSSRRFGGDIASTRKVFAWAAPNIRYQPLYFEDVSLERYGQTKGLVKQPFVSAGKFATDGFLLGARARRVHPRSCDSPLGFCRPGSPETANGGCGCNCDSKNIRQCGCQSCR